MKTKTPPKAAFAILGCVGIVLLSAGCGSDEHSIAEWESLVDMGSMAETVFWCSVGILAGALPLFLISLCCFPFLEPGDGAIPWCCGCCIVPCAVASAVTLIICIVAGPIWGYAANELSQSCGSQDPRHWWRRRPSSKIQNLCGTGDDFLIPYPDGSTPEECCSSVDLRCGSKVCAAGTVLKEDFPFTMSPTDNWQSICCTCNQAGHYDHNAQCAPCQGGSTRRRRMAHTCTACGAGYFNTGAFDDCQECGKGSSTRRRRADACVACGPGYNKTSPASDNCEAVSCPANSAGLSVAEGCLCNAGYSGMIAASSLPPFFTGECTCNQTGPDYSGRCLPFCGLHGFLSNTYPCDCGGAVCIENEICNVNFAECVNRMCPANSHGTMSSGCECDQWYSGNITWVNHSLVYEGQCDLLPPPPTDTEMKVCLVFTACVFVLFACRICILRRWRLAGVNRTGGPIITLEDRIGITMAFLIRIGSVIGEEFMLDDEAHLPWLFGLPVWAGALILHFMVAALWQIKTPNECTLLVGLAALDALALALIFDLTTHTYAFFFIIDVPHRRQQQLPFHVAHIASSIIGLYGMSLRAVPWEMHPVSFQESIPWDLKIKQTLRGFTSLATSPLRIALPKKCRGGLAEEKIAAGRMFLRDWAEFVYLFIALWLYIPQQTDPFDMRVVFMALICSQLATWFIPLLLSATTCDALVLTPQAKTLFTVTWVSDLLTDLPEIVISLLLSWRDSSALSVNDYLAVNIVVKTAVLTRMIIYQPVRRGFDFSLGSCKCNPGLFEEKAGSKPPSVASRWIRSIIPGVFSALSILSVDTVLRLTNFSVVVEVVESNKEDVSAPSEFAANVQRLGMGGLLFALSWFLLGLFRRVQRNQAIVLSKRGCRCGKVALILLGLLFAFNLVWAVWGDKSELVGLEISSAILGLFSITLPSLVGVAWPKRSNVEHSESSTIEVEPGQVELGCNCATLVSQGMRVCEHLAVDILMRVSKHFVVDILNLVTWATGVQGIYEVMGAVTNLVTLPFKEAAQSSNFTALQYSLQWVDLIIVACFTTAKDGTVHVVLIVCLILKLLTWVLPMGKRAIVMLNKAEHDVFHAEIDKARYQIVHSCQISNVLLLLRFYLVLDFGISMLWWALFLWMTTPIYVGDVIYTEEQTAAMEIAEQPAETAPLPAEQTAKKMEEQTITEELRVWRWICLSLRFMAWWGQVVVFWFELAAEVDVPWLRYWTACVVLINIAFLRVDFFVLVHVPVHEIYKPLWKYLPQMSAVVTACILIVDILANAWYGYVSVEQMEGSSNGTSIHDAHWILAVWSITLLILPELLFVTADTWVVQPCLLDKLVTGTVKKAMIKFLAFPFFLCGTPSGLHSMIELADVVSFLLLLKSIAQGDYDTTHYKHASWIALPDIRIIMFSLLVLQMLIWVVPITFLAFKPDTQAEQLGTYILQFSMVVEICTDVPELLVLFVWGGWRGHGSIFIVTTLIIDTFLTLKSAIYNPMRHELCCKSPPVEVDVQQI